ncbi:hypothetical protein [Nocardia yamanashiensis]|uniref:hypothetical protein n=1 Tax=Nocardia yamanashiensis TaxID=209247 RepID=UPI00082CFF0D|nr:hypothetical protein [Nocardia yamanashiensis]
MIWYDCPYCFDRHLEPRCTRPLPEPYYRPGMYMSSLRHIDKLQRDGILPDPDEVVFRWWWLFAAGLVLFVFFALLILF